MNLKEVDLREIYRIWKSNLGVYRCFFRSSPFVSLKTFEDFTLYESTYESDENLLNIVLNAYKEDYFTIVDLGFDDILDLSLNLNNENNIKPILNINLLFNHFGLVGTKKNISKLINFGLKLKNIKSNKYIMMIFYDRYNENIDASKIYDKLNNQYGVSEEDFPKKEFLKELGFKGITVITKEKIKSDLMEYIDVIGTDMKVNLIRVDK